MAHLSLTFFGSFQATLGGKPLTAFRSAKVQGLLVYLALTNQQPLARDVLAALFWPDEPDAVAKKNLRQSLYQLRQVLGDTASQEGSYLLVTRSTVQFDPASDHELDATAFATYLENDQLEQAVTLYQGELLPGFTCDSLPFEEWLRQERERLHRLALDALFELTARSLARADYHAAQSLARRQLALEPWREKAHRQLMQALALLGERSAALAQYESCRRVLEEELGAEPSAETEALVAHIRDQQLGSGARGEPVRSFGRRRLTTPFVGRNSEHGALVRAFQRARRDGAQVVALLGEAGIGKTRLAQNFLAWAATQGADILRGRAFETSGRLSYQPLTQMMRQRLERENAPEDLLSDLWLTQLTRILPELRDRYPDLPAPTQEEPTARQHLFEAITRLGQALAERAPLVIFIDDWQWADAASLDVLHYAALSWLEERAPILVLLTLRQEALMESPDLQTWLTRLKHDAACVELNLAALSRAETEQLIRALLEPEEGDAGAPPAGVESPPQLTQFSRWLFDETDGQPFFLVETLRALVEEGLFQPDTASQAWQVNWPKLDEQALGSGSRVLPGVWEIIRGWLDRITAPAGELLTAAAVLGQGASFDNLRHVAGLEEAQALTALDELLARELLLEADEASPAHSVAMPGSARGDPAYHFSHQKLREVVYTEAGAARRRILHRRAFEALQAATAPAAELAHQALNAGLWAEAIQYSIAAGNEAMDLLAVRVAIAHYRTAWQLAEQVGWPEAVSGADRQGLYSGLGRAYELAEAWQQAQETYQAMIAYAQSIEAPAIECMGLNRLATVYINSLKDPQQTLALLEQARTVAEQNGDRRGLAETEWNLSMAARMAEDTYQARHHGEQALTIARELGHPQLLARCLNSLAYVHSRLRQWDTVEVYASEARDLYAAAGNRILEADSQRVVGWSQLYSGRPQDSLVTLRETFVFSQQIEDLWGEAECGWRLALTLLELGDYGEAIKLARQAVKQARVVGQPTMVVLALSTWGTVQRTVMALECARETLLEALAESTEKSLTGFGDWAPAELCALCALTGDWDQAHVYARQTLQSRGDEALLPMGFTGWYETEALLRGGDGDLARAEVERLGEIVGDNQRYRLPLFRSLAVLAQWDGDTDQAITRLQAAAAFAQEMGLPGEEWSVLGALGALHEVQGDRAKAQRAWKASADIIFGLAETIDEEDLRAGFLRGVSHFAQVSKDA
jgi:DNA-binding SARP family transcriptional activator/predicted ATPase/tetratricopeptide (TPR) repeat protein